MVEKVIINVVTFPIKVLWGNFKLFERNVWPQQEVKTNDLNVAGSIEKYNDNHPISSYSYKI